MQHWWAKGKWRGGEPLGGPSTENRQLVTILLGPPQGKGLALLSSCQEPRVRHVPETHPRHLSSTGREALRLYSPGGEMEAQRGRLAPALSPCAQIDLPA